MESNRNKSMKTKKLTRLAMLFAASIVLSIVEGLLPPLPFAAAGVKIGLSNIPVMYTLFFINPSSAFAAAILKSLFAALTRGTVAGILSLSGGILSITAMYLLTLIFREKISYLLLSIFGAVFHNIGQLIAVSIIYTSVNVFIYLPVLLIGGVGAGIATSFLLRFIMPSFKNMQEL